MERALQLETVVCWSRPKGHHANQRHDWRLKARTSEDDQKRSKKYFMKQLSEDSLHSMKFIRKYLKWPKLHQHRSQTVSGGWGCEQHWSKVIACGRANVASQPWKLDKSGMCLNRLCCPTCVFHCLYSIIPEAANIKLCPLARKLGCVWSTKMPRIPVLLMIFRSFCIFCICCQMLSQVPVVSCWGNLRYLFGCSLIWLLFPGEGYWRLKSLSRPWRWLAWPEQPALVSKINEWNLMQLLMQLNATI